MKKMMTLAMMMTIAISAAAMSYSAARNEALFLSDKMAYELGLTNSQYEAVYEINLDYLLNVDTRADVFGFWWDVRNRDLRFVLTPWQYDRFVASTYFYRPLGWSSGSWTFAIYSRYAHDRMFMHRPAVFVSFRGGHSHRNGSYYSGHHFDKPIATTGHGGHTPTHGHGSISGGGHSTHKPSVGGTHTPTMGHGNTSGGHRGTTTGITVSRSGGSTGGSSFGTRSGSVVSHSSPASRGGSASKGTFGGRR